jgi:hypothetical protein
MEAQAEKFRSQHRLFLDALKVLSGLCWTLAYLLIIRRGFIDQTWGMPLAALCANVAWEFIFAFVYPHGKTQRAVNTVWFLFDLVLVYQAARFDPAAWLLLPGLPLAAAAILWSRQRLGDRRGQYSAFGQNLLMSVLFVAMIMERGDLAGQSMAIALLKLVGTLIPAVSIYCWYGRSRVVAALGAAIFVFDLWYVVLVVQAAG